MVKRGSILDSFNSRMTPRQGVFDIALLPLNLSEGRNIGELSGLFLFTAPKKSESSRQADIFITLFHVDNISVPDAELTEWAKILSDAYFSARGSFTMGVTTAVKSLTTFLRKDKKRQIMPTIYLNIAVLRDRSLLLAHAGPVNTTVISANSVQSFCNEGSLPLQLDNNDLSFYTAEVHSEDIILLCPRVPSDWTNSSIMEVTGDSPLNAIKFLLDRSGGNLKAAVIQLKAGKGQISFRTKTSITANVQPEFEDKVEAPQSRRRRSSDLINQSGDSLADLVPPDEKPLLRQRKSMELFSEPEVPAKVPETAENTTENSQDNNDTEENSTSRSLTGDQELPGSDAFPYDPEQGVKPNKKKESANGYRKIVGTFKPIADEDDEKPIATPKKKRRFNFGTFLLILGCGILIPIIVVSILFFVYSGRSTNQLHREYLDRAVSAAQTALQERDEDRQEALWTDVLSNVDLALNYGTSPAAQDLRKEAMQKLDEINGGISTVYSYANNSKLPQGLNITEITASGQYTYALDSTSGSVLRFTASGSGLSLDNTFSCTPGTYKAFGDSNNAMVQVGALVDYVMLPSGNPHSFILAGVDAEANVLYCSSFTDNQAAKLQKPQTEKFTIRSLAFLNNAMYVLDTQASAVWEYLFSNQDGFVYEPSNYYGSYSPYLSDVIDFAMFKEYAYFLKGNGTLLMCDYTAYRPACQTISVIESSDNSARIDLSLHQFQKIMVNSSPDNSIYIMDAKLQTVLNLSAKANFIRYITPNRSIDDISKYSQATGFGITGQNRLLWSYKNDLYIGNMP